jgi:hypothetical protein
MAAGADIFTAITGLNFSTTSTCTELRCMALKTLRCTYDWWKMVCSSGPFMKCQWNTTTDINCSRHLFFAHRGDSCKSLMEHKYDPQKIEMLCWECKGTSSEYSLTRAEYFKRIIRKKPQAKQILWKQLHLGALYPRHESDGGRPKRLRGRSGPDDEDNMTKMKLKSLGLWATSFNKLSPNIATTISRKDPFKDVLKQMNSN